MGTMTDEAKALVERLRKARVWPDYSQSRVTIETAHQAADLIETQAREIERLNAILSELNDADVIARTMAENKRLREANQAAAECVAAMMEECARYRAALAGDSHDQ